VSPSATHTCGWLTHGRSLFFACPKKSDQKKGHPGSLHRAQYARSPARLASAGRSPNSPAAVKRGSGSIMRLATPPGLARCSARDTGRLATHLRPWRGDFSKPPYPQITMWISGARGFHIPVARAEYRRPTGGSQASPCSSRAAYWAADELASARWGEERRGMSRAPGRAFFGFFLCTSKERNPPAVRGTAITTRPQAAQYSY
jgi:hypothetical protein